MSRGLFGLAIGSFLNVVIYRVPKGMSVVSPRSACPSCGTPIFERDNMPVVRGSSTGTVPALPRADLCSVPPGRARLRALCSPGWPARFGYDWALPAFLVLFAGLLALSVIDVETLLLPKKIVWPLSIVVAALFVMAAAITGDWHDLLVGAISRCRLVRAVLRA